MLLGAVLAAGLLLAASQAQAITVVDDFEEGFFDLFVDDGVSGPYFTTFDSDDQQGLTSIMGNRRRAELAYVAGTGIGRSSDAHVNNQVAPDDHWIDYSTSTLFESQLKLYYGKLPGGLSLGSDIALGDLTLSGANDIINLKYLASDLGSTTTVTLVDSSAVSYSKGISTVSGPSNLKWKLSDFAANGVDVTDIDYMIITLDGKPSGDYTIDGVELGFIPEPLTMIGVAMGVGGLVRYTRKRRMA
jgi:hypothetical protein